MKAILKQKIDILQAQAYLELDILEEAAEIKSFLEGDKIFVDNPELDERVKDYIKSLDFMTKDGSITKTGEEVIRTGKRYVSEAGVYTIKYCKNDSLFGDHIFDYKDYESHIVKENWQELKFSNSDNSNLITNDKAKLKNVKLILNGEEPSKDIYYFEKEWEWEFEDFNIINQRFKEFLKCEDKILLEETDEHSMRHKISVEDLLNKIPASQWNQNRKRIKQSWDDIKNSNLSIFTKVLDKEFKMNFDENNEIILSQVPIMPETYKDSKHWVEHIIRSEVEKEYQSKNTFKEILQNACDDEAFIDYADNLKDELEHSRFLQTTQSKDKVKQDRVFWHLRAGYDLNPDIKISLADQIAEEVENSSQRVILNCSIGDEYSLQKIADEIKGFMHIYEAPEKLIYLDPYVQQPMSQKKLMALMQAFEVNLKQASLITLSAEDAGKDKFANVLENAGVNVIKVSKNLTNNYRLPHDRYLILQYADEQIPRVFKFTHSELVKYAKNISFNGITPQTIGTTLDLSVIETKIEIMNGALAEKINEILGAR